MDEITNQAVDSFISLLKDYFSIPKIVAYVTTHFVSTLLAILLIVFYKRIKHFFKRLFRKALEKFFSENPGIATFFTSIISFLIDFMLLFLILKLLGVNFSSIAALFGALSLVLGFAFKDTLSNFFGGIILLTFKPFKVNDVVEYKNFVGTIKKIEIFYTTLVNFQNEVVIIPNGNIINTEIRNINSNSHRRLDLQIGVGYGSNIEQVKATINEIIQRRKDDLFYIEEVEPVIGMGEIGASSLNFDIRVFVRENQYLMAKFYLNESIKTEFDKLGIELPYNIIDLQVNPNFNKLNIKNINN